MKIYDWAAAPNPKRLRMFLVEKGLQIEIVQVAGDGFVLTPEYKAKYPQAMVPMLELDDGRQIGESTSICRYLEELYPDPPMLGRDPYERAIVDMWDRRAFDQGMTAVAEIFRNSNPYFKDRGLAGFANPVPQLPQLVERGHASLERFFLRFDEQLGKSRFIAADVFTQADCTLYCSIEFAGWVSVTIPDGCKNLQRWWKEVGDRPSAKA